jgi:RNA polymerase sigma-70 factor (ECF subfamily)
MPDESEVLGLLALLLLHDARRGARVDEQGGLVLIADQDREQWDRVQIAEGVGLVECALRRGVGVYALQAAIAALHAEASSVDATDWRQIAALYGELFALDPSPVIALNRAVAVAMADGPAAGLALVDVLEPALSGLHLFHSTRGHLLHDLGRGDEAAAAYGYAIDLAANQTERAFLERRLAIVRGSAGD